jgi:acetylornithine deacetylase/succinyl-diaminopimelate desuccinylase-like protein
MYTILRAKNEGLSEDMVRLAQKLVQTPSPTFQEGPVADRVEAKMTELGYDDVVRDGAGNVLGLMLGHESAPTVLLACHMDVAAAEDDAPWDRPAHSGDIRDGRLYGAGASDCKAGLAAHVFCGALLKRALLPMRGNLVVAATVAEERGGSVGVRELMDKTLPDLDLRPTCAILGEPTGLGLYYGHDGWVELDVRVQGPDPCHVDDAAEAIFDGLSTLGTERQDDGIEALVLSRPRFEDLTGSRRATIHVNRRVGPGCDLGRVVHHMKHTAALAVGATEAVAVNVRVCEESRQLYTGQATLVRHITHAWSTDPFHPLMDRARHALAAAGCEVAPGKWELGRLGMGTAGGVLVDEFGVPTIGYGPGQETTCHCANERVSVDRVIEATYGTASIVHSLIGLPVFGWGAEGEI